MLCDCAGAAADALWFPLDAEAWLAAACWAAAIAAALEATPPLAALELWCVVGCDARLVPTTATRAAPATVRIVAFRRRRCPRSRCATPAILVGARAGGDSKGFSWEPVLRASLNARYEQR